ncbi:protein of unknown function (plasmid) [Streptantibioticus cattleyicolor NRRL 8057 = DSM 46488]|nr:protein of unknown function [Streptantibioticus cattleyicolor NRRL 8057 = DSM 46488]
MPRRRVGARPRSRSTLAPPTSSTAALIAVRQVRKPMMTPFEGRVLGTAFRTVNSHTPRTRPDDPRATACGGAAGAPADRTHPPGKRALPARTAPQERARRRRATRPARTPWPTRAVAVGCPHE